MYFLHEKNLSISFAFRLSTNGIYFIKDAVVKYLYDEHNQEPVQTRDIAKYLNIVDSEELYLGKWLVFDIILDLQSEKRVQYVDENGGGWKITETEKVRQRVDRELETVLEYPKFFRNLHNVNIQVVSFTPNYQWFNPVLLAFNP